MSILIVLTHFSIDHRASLGIGPSFPSRCCFMWALAEKPLLS